MNIGHDWRLIESVMARYQSTDFITLLDMPVVKIFDYYEYGAYWMQMDGYFASLRMM